jgi:ribosomal protein S18 acetylase RimI-like enzyme
MKIVLKEFQPSQWQAYRDLRRRALADAPDAFGSTLEQSLKISDAAWQQRLIDIQPRKDLPLYASAAQEMAGMSWANIQPENPRQAHLFQMWVAPEFRRSGAARMLLERAVNWTREQGCTELLLSVTEGNSGARALYESAGFVATGATEPLRPMSPLMAEEMVMRF